MKKSFSGHYSGVHAGLSFTVFKRGVTVKRRNGDSVVVDRWVYDWNYGDESGAIYKTRKDAVKAAKGRIDDHNAIWSAHRPITLHLGLDEVSGGRQ